MITYYKNQKELAKGLVEIIDTYWKQKTSEQDFLNYVNKIAQNNSEKLYKDNDFTSVINQRLGKKRTELLYKILRTGEFTK